MRKIAVFFLFLLAGCVKETELDTGIVDGDAVLNLTIPGTRSGSAPYDESSIVSARLIVYHSYSSSGAKKLVLNTDEFQWVDDEIKCRKIIPAGYINVYLIANERAALTEDALDIIEDSPTESQLENIRLTYNALIDPTAAGITMFRAHKGLKIMPGTSPNGDGNITYADGMSLPLDYGFGKVERNAVKLSIELVCNYTDAPWTSSDKPLTFESVTLKSVPNKPWLADGKFYGLNDDMDYFDVSEYVVTTEDTGTGTKTEFTLIVPEHIVSNNECYTYLEVNCEWNGSDMTYKLPLGDGLSKNEGDYNNTANMLDGTAPLSDYNLVRNTEYKITAMIKSQGGTDSENVDVYLAAVPWGTPVGVDGDILNRILNVSAIAAKVTDVSQARIYFNSNQPVVSLDDKGKDSSGADINVTSFLDAPTSAQNLNYVYNSDTKTGTGYVDLVRAANATNGQYKIYLDAGGLRREITVNVAIDGVVEESNCYMVAPGSEAILIPVSRANKSLLGTQIGTSDIFTGVLLWTDNSKGLAVDSNIESIEVVGTGDSGYIKVKPGSGSGNAVIAAKVDEDIVWSWHIWVTDYDPGNQINGETHVYAGNAFNSDGIYYNGGNQKRMMDRNLGATWTAADGLPIGAVMTTPTPTAAKAAKAYGLLYQWGRKDPFTPASGTPTYNPTQENGGIVKIYNAKGTELTENGTSGTGIKLVSIESDTDNNLPNAVRNPMTFYCNDTSPGDWYTTNSANYRNDNLWCADGGNPPTAGAKTVYDPCPPGWRVPLGGSHADNNPWAGFSDGKADSTTETKVGIGEPAIFSWYTNGTTQSTMTTNATNGRYYTGNNANAWYPASGLRNSESGTGGNVGEWGYSWSAVITPINNSPYGSPLVFTKDKIGLHSNSTRALGFPVRCIQE